MILYHGSNTDIKTIDLTMCRPYKYFGRGFYLTTLQEQAERMAKRVARIYEGPRLLMRTTSTRLFCLLPG